MSVPEPLGINIEPAVLATGVLKIGPTDNVKLGPAYPGTNGLYYDGHAD